MGVCGLMYKVTKLGVLEIKGFENYFCQTQNKKPIQTQTHILRL